MNRFFFIVLIYFFIFVFLHTEKVFALNMSNTDYILHMGNLDTASGKPNDLNYSLNFTLGQTTPGKSVEPGYSLYSGFQYVTSKEKFTFTISPLTIDFGILTPNNPVTRQQKLSVIKGSSGGYLITAFENHPLSNPAGAQIPNTTCDNGNCNDKNAGFWRSTLTYGFGYRCEYTTDSLCSTDFQKENFYKQFADESINKMPENIVSGDNTVSSRQETLTYKVNIPTSQFPGDYSNTITFIAVPTF
jgi:hypothetical protein